MAHDDYFLALQLQSEFDQEWDNGYNKSQKSPVILIEDDDECPAKRRKPETLIDPEWEVVDPTPDIHGLFMGFNKRFFWNSLGAVEVRWSPRMTSCAGICSYNRRSGLCSVRLSEPLLKLRPRSDLVETLLHEMIHAYLFITDNDRDRDGHGPNFQKHMFRINKAAGTKISIYHSFHDEVRVYQTHWWRCNGPCKDRPPFFGMVKRSMNRAPGPNDLWWPFHQATCGGTFIKVKEPPPKQKTKTKGKEPANKSDIRNYTVPSPKKNIFGVSSLPDTSKGAVKKPLTGNKTVPVASASRVVGFSDLNHTGKGTFTKEKTKGGKVFGNGGKYANNKTKSKSVGTGSAISNRGSGTLVVTSTSKNANIVPSSQDNGKEMFLPFVGQGYKLGGSTNGKTGSPGICSLLTRFTNSCTDNVNNNRDCRVSEINSPEKCMDDFLNRSHSDDELASIEFDESNEDSCGDEDVNCPVCGVKTKRDDMQIHLQSCDILNSTINNMNDSGTLEVSDDEDEVNVGPDGKKVNPHSESALVNKLPCPCCSKSIVESDINKHLDECLSIIAINEFQKDW